MSKTGKFVDPKGANVLRQGGHETRTAYKGGKSKPLPAKRFDVKKGKSK